MKIMANGVGLNVVDVGAGAPALVFLHFMGGSARTWSEVIDRLAPSHRCVALDARGAGDSDAPEHGYDTRTLADDVTAVVDRLGLESYVLVGHSMGGKTAQAVAARRPAGLRGLVLVASSPPSPMAVGSEDRHRMKRAYDTRESTDFVLRNVLLGSPLSEELHERTIADALRFSLPARAGWTDIGMLDDITSEVSSVDVPVVVIAGELDRVDAIDVVRTQILPRYPRATLHVLPGKGHLLPLEAPGAVADIVAGVELCADGRIMAV